MVEGIWKNKNLENFIWKKLNKSSLKTPEKVFQDRKQTGRQIKRKDTDRWI